jgi:vacuolar-type H+-ATPase catalytic subunit A/Vma1
MFDSMPKLLERSGTSSRGSITAFYTILVDADELDEPVSDTVRGILDGHIVLSRNMAEHYHYPAIDVLGSISRLDRAVAGPETMKAVGYIRRLMAVYAETEDLINVGAYQAGANPEIDEAVAKHKAIEDFLIQAIDEKTTLTDTLKMLGEIAGIEIPETETAEYLRKAFGAFNFSGGSITVPGYLSEGESMPEAETPQQEEAAEALYETSLEEEPVAEEVLEIKDEIPPPEAEEIPFEVLQNETDELPLIDL